MRRRWRIALAACLVSLPAAAQAATVFRVGPGGTHTTVQAALDAAQAEGGDCDVQVAAGRWPERLTIRLRASDSRLRRLRLLGGYAAPGFTARSEDPARTQIDGGGTGTVLRIDVDADVTLVISGLAVTGGRAPSGGGILANLRGHARLWLEKTHVVGNRAEGGDYARAGGIDAAFADNAQFWMRDNLIQGNRVEALGTVNGGGAQVSARGAAYLDIRSNRFLDNLAVSKTNAAFDVGLGVSTGDGAGARVEDNILQGNRGTASTCVSVLSLSTVASEGGTAGAWIEARRNQVLDSAAESGYQVGIFAAGGTRITLSDGIVARGTGSALSLNPQTDAEVHAVNLTLTGNSGEAVLFWGRGTASLSNTIIYANGGDVDSAVTESHNLRDDPHFVDPLGDYHLQPGSPALDAGNNAPSGGLGPRDIDGDLRVRGGTVDIGADEVAPAGGIHGDPVCSALPFVGSSWPVCRCVSEPDLRHARCGALVDDVFLDLRIPLAFEPGASLKAEWRITPWEPFASPYSMAAEALIDGQWVHQTWLGPTSVALKDGQTVTEPFVWQLAGKGTTPVRTTFEYLRPGFKETSRVTIEVTMPDPSGVP